MATQPELVNLVRSTARGDQIAFKELYSETSPRLFSLCLRMLKDREWAEEVLQEAFVKVWHYASEYHEDRGCVTTWLTSIVRYRALDHLRAHKATESLDNQLTEQVSSEADPLQWLTRGDEINALELCLDQLTDQQKQLIVMSFIEGLTHQELMQRIPTPLGTIKSWIRRGLQSLRRCLQL